MPDLPRRGTWSTALVPECKPNLKTTLIDMLHRLFGLSRSRKNTVDNNRYGIDINCNYCPVCEEEYRAEIETCASCSISLISGSERLELLRRQEADFHSHSAEISAADELVTLQTGKLLNLKQLQQILKKDCIPSVLAGGNTSTG